MQFSWSNRGFGLESFETSCERLEKAGVKFIELHGNHYVPDLGYNADEVRKIMDAHGIKTGGVCGMFSSDNVLSSNRHIKRQAAIDYIKREAEFTAKTDPAILDKLVFDSVNYFREREEEILKL